MGTIQEEYLIVQGVYDEEEKVLDNWIARLPEEWRNLFFKCPCHSNGYVTYFMNWDGSKEGWDDSEKGNALRESFIQVCLENVEGVEVLHIKPEGEVFNEDTIERRESANVNELDAPCVVCMKFEEVDSGMCESCRNEAIKHYKKRMSEVQKR